MGMLQVSEHQKVGMSSEVGWCHRSNDQSSRLDDVSQAWDSLHQAKEVLQGIENRIDAGDQRRSRAHRIRRRLQLERSSFLENTENKNKSISAETASFVLEGETGSSSEREVLSDPKIKDHSPSGRGDDGSMFLVLAKKDYSSKKPSEGRVLVKTPSHSCDRGESDTIVTKQNLMEDSARSGVHCNSCDSCVPGRWDPSSDQETVRTHVRNSAEVMEEVASPVLRSRQSFASQSGIWNGSHSQSPRVFLRGTWDGPYVQKLECLKSRSPETKLEKLKDRIREQKQRLCSALPGQHGPHLRQLIETVSKSSLRRTVRKVTFAPPPPVYRGFSSVNGKSGTFPADEEILKSGTEDLGATGQESIGYRDQKQAKDQKECFIKRKRRSHVPEKSSSESPASSSKEKDSVSKRYGASAWREGQKLVRKLLGPLPSSAKLADVPLRKDRDTNYGLANILDKPATVQTESSTSTMLDNKTGKNPKASPETQEKTVMPADGKLTKDAGQILRALNSQNQHCTHKKSPDPEKPMHYHEGIQEEQTGMESPKDALDVGVNPRKLISRRGKSASPERSRPSSRSPVGKHADKENLSSTEIKKSTCKVRSYSVEEVREFMNRKIAERQRKELEAKRAKRKAMELKNKRMEELFRKQKDAFPKREQQTPNKRAVQTSKAMLGCNKQQLHERSIARNPEKDIDEWVQMTSCTLLKSEGHESSYFDAKKIERESTKVTKNELGLPYLLPYEKDVSSPLKLKDLDLPKYSPPKHLTFIMSNKRTDTNSVSPERSSQQSPYRSKQERLLAIHAIAKELEERIQMEAGRLRMASGFQNSNEKGMTGIKQDTILNSFMKQDKFQNELSRMLSLNTPFLLRSLESLKASPEKVGITPHFSSAGESNDTSKIKEDTKQTMAYTVLSSPTTASEDLPWNSDLELLEHFGVKQEADDMLQKQLRGSAGLKAPTMESHLQKDWKQEVTAVSPSGILSCGSAWSKAAKQDEYGKMDTSAYIQNSEGISLSHLENKSTTCSDKNDSNCPQTSGSRIAKGHKKNVGEEGTNRSHFMDSCAAHLSNRQRTHFHFVGKLKAHDLQQEHKLAILRQKAELEAQEAQRSLDELLKHRFKRVDDSKSKRAIRYPAEDGTEKLTEQLFEINAKHIINIEEGITEGRKTLVLTTEKAGESPFKLQEPLGDVHQESSLPGPGEYKGSERPVIEDSGDSSEPATNSTSKWSEISPYYGGPHMFSRFTLEMAQQYLREEELRSRHQAALLRLREEALKEKTKAELAWLEHQRMRFEIKRNHEKVAEIVKKQQEIVTQLQQEQAEISHLQNINKAAHQERKLLLKHQRELLQMQQSTAHLQQKLQGLADQPQFSDDRETVTARNEKPLDPWMSLKGEVGQTGVDIPAVLENETGHVQTDERQHKEDNSHSAQKKTKTPKCRWDTERVQQWKLKLQTQGADVLKTEAKMPDDPADHITSQMTEEASVEDQEIAAESHVSWYPTELPKSAVEEEVLNLVHVPRGDKYQQHTESNIELKESLCHVQPETQDNTSQGLSQVVRVEDSPLSQTDEHMVKMELAQSQPSVTREFPEQKERLCSQLKGNDVPMGESNSDLNLTIALKPEIRTSITQKQERESEDLENEEVDLSYADVKQCQMCDTPPHQGAINGNEEVFAVGGVKLADGKKRNAHLIKGDEDCHREESSRGLSEHQSSSDSLTNDTSRKSESIISYPSLPEFKKVSAVWIEISGSSASLSGLDNAQDTDISDSEVYGSDQKPSEKFTGTEISAENQSSLISRSDELPPLDGTSFALKQRSQVQDARSKNTPSPGVHMDASSDSRDKMHNITLNEEVFEVVVGPHTGTTGDCLEDCIGEKIRSHHETDYKEDLNSPSGSQRNSLSYSSDFSENRETSEPQKYTAEVDKGGNNCEPKGLSYGSQPKIKKQCFVLEDIIRPIHSSTERLGNTVTLQPKTSAAESKLAPLASESLPTSEDLSQSDEKTNELECLTEEQGACTSNPIPAANNSKATSAREMWNTTEVGASSDIEDLQAMTGNNEKQPATADLISKKTESKPFLLTSSTHLFSQITNFPPQSKEDVIFINDEVLLPIDEDTLSEILSPVDEVLSYGSSEFPSTKKDLSCQSDDLPYFPDDVSIKSDDLHLHTEDFPSPPEEMILHERENQCPALDVVVLEKLPCLSDKVLLDNVPLPFPVLSHVASFKDGDSYSRPTKKEHIVKENIYDAGWMIDSNTSFLQSSHSIHSPAFSFQGQTNVSPKMLSKKSKPFLTLSTEEANEDRLLSFEVGDRVLVKSTHPGTLKYKGNTCFDEGYWAGVALDKPEGDHDGKYEGFRYFECAKHCGVFVRPHHISRLLEDDGESMDDAGDEDPFHDGPAPGDENSSDHQGTRFNEKKPKENDNEKGNTSALKENRSRLHMSRSSGIDNGASSSHIGNEIASVAAVAGCLESEHELTDQQCKRRTVKQLPRHGFPRTNQERSFEKIMNKQVCSQFLPGRKETLADELSSQIFRELLCDTLNVLSGTPQHKHKCTSAEYMHPSLHLNSKDVFFQEGNGHSSPTPAEALDFLLGDAGTFTNPDKSCKVHGTPRAAIQIGKNIVAKFIDDAMKEYKKIKKKQGGYNDTSLETSQVALPFLQKILDAGVFGDSETFDQPLAQPAEGMRIPRQNFYRLDRWCTAQWKRPKELSLVVPHNATYVKELVIQAVGELWGHHHPSSVHSRLPKPTDFECEQFKGDDLNAESKRLYNQVILDLAQELLETERPFPTNAPIYLREKEKAGCRFSRHMHRKQDMNEVKSFIQAEILGILKLEGGDLEMQRKLQKMTKVGSCKRDRVDILLIQELHQEEQQWTDYSKDELTVKMKLTEDILDTLVHDTIEVLKKIHTSRTHRQRV